MRCLRKIVNKTRRYRVRNIDIRETIGNIPCMKYIEHQRMKWAGHFFRMPHNQPAARAYNAKHSGIQSGEAEAMDRWSARNLSKTQADSSRGNTP
jgi:hypothetical protein